jgi:small subunit ribosomal protein S8
MSMTDTIADMLTRIRNAQKSRLISMVVPHSKLKIAVLEVLEEEGYVGAYKIVENAKNMRIIEVDLKYSVEGKPAIREIKKVSTPGKRIYSAVNDLEDYYSGMGIYILSTSKGVISDRRARQLGVGGEVICKVF